MTTEAVIAQTILGDSFAIRRVRALILKVAATELPVLIQGPTGSGKELVAQAMHRLSRKPGDLVALNVCALGDSMFEDALFGHVKGAFTGALGDARGYLAEADRGTLFLDEIGGLALAAQAKLLRVLETRTFRPLGARRDARSDFRVVAATNEPLDRLVTERRFRDDLRHRLSGVVIDVPALCDHPEDIPLLARHFAGSMSRQSTRDAGLSDGALDALAAHAWPGNVRELKHVVERAVTLADRSVITRDAIVAMLAPGRAPAPAGEATEFARRRMLTVLEECGWDTALAAARLGIHRATMYRRLQRLGLSVFAARLATDTPQMSRGVATCQVDSRATIRANSHPVACESRDTRDPHFV